MIAAVADTHASIWHFIRRPRPDAHCHIVHKPRRGLADSEHVFVEAVFTAAIVQAMRQVSRADVPDMPDRMVAATAVYFDVPVISRDRRIRAASLKTIW
jgi:hypothetical protein